jgi:hypothetical protein
VKCPAVRRKADDLPTGMLRRRFFFHGHGSVLG